MLQIFEKGAILPQIENKIEIFGVEKSKEKLWLVK